MQEIFHKKWCRSLQGIDTYCDCQRGEPLATRAPVTKCPVTAQRLREISIYHVQDEVVQQQLRALADWIEKLEKEREPVMAKLHWLSEERRRNNERIFALGRLRMQVESLRDWKSPDGVLQVKDLKWFQDFYSKDHPEANGRKPTPGEHGYTLRFPLQDGSELRVHCGEETLTRFSDMIGRLLIDNATEEREHERD